MSVRFGKADLEVINEALALLEVHVDDEYPDDYDESAEAEVMRRKADGHDAQIKRTRRKVWQRMGLL